MKQDDNDEVIYILPGGSQNAGETLTDAVKREVAEEIGIDVEPLSLEFVIEGVYGEALHRVDFVFLCEYIGLMDQDSSILPSDENQVEYEWLKIKNIIRTTFISFKITKADH